LEKNRLDVVLLQRGMVPSREKARALIMAGKVLVDGTRVEKSGTRVPLQAEIIIQDDINPYVSRGGLKLEGAIRDFNLVFTNKTVLDVGASTGGFTHCALQHGACRVVAVDVGYGQLDWTLRNDERVVVRERTNIRYFTLEDLGEMVDVVTIDASFISLGLILPVVSQLVRPGGEVVALVKPQFEAGRGKVGKKGVVKDPAVHIEVLERVMRTSVASGLSVVGITYSPLKGPRGNIEYFMYMIRNGANYVQSGLDLPEVVTGAFRCLGGRS
jgi:23S rRNA (cytidine1920-2'-O)/16S rRNA (cytidine1409-2'-O)-methyltransferase